MSEMLDRIRVTPTGFSMPVADTLPVVVQRIVETLQPEKIVLFGSYADGTPTSDSDVDLLVVMETTAPHVERYLAVSRLLRPRPFPVDILVKRPDEIQSALEAGDFFIHEVLSRGQVLYERDH
jgi:predicted nucleotidyltransferase